MRSGVLSSREMELDTQENDASSMLYPTPSRSLSPAEVSGSLLSTSVSTWGWAPAAGEVQEVREARRGKLLGGESDVEIARAISRGMRSRPVK
jgi:hypothetical protein